MRPTETNRILKEAKRQGIVAASSATSTSGPQSAKPVAAGADDGAGNWVAYGRLDITEFDSFLLSGD